MYKFIFIVVIILFSSIYQRGYGQSYYYKNYTVNDGLPSTEVFQVIQDKKGYIWLATDQGVSRYNGYEFQNFNVQNGLPENTILMLFEDYKGRVWFVSFLGKLSWFENDSIHEYKYNDVIEKYDSKKLHPIKKSFFVDSLDQVYMGFYNSELIKIDKNGILKEISNPKDKNTVILQKMPEDVVLYNYRKNTSSFEAKYLNGKDNFIKMPEKVIRATRDFAICYEEKILYSKLKKLFVFDSTGNYHSKSFKNEIIWMSKDNDENVWIGFIDKGAIAFKNTQINNTEYEILNGKSVSSVFQDSEGGYWFSTLANGLFYFPSLKIKSITKENGLESNEVKEVEPFKGELLVGGNYSTIYSFNVESTKPFINFPTKDRRELKLIKAIDDSLFVSFIGSSTDNTFVVCNNKVVQKAKGFSRDILKLKDNTIFLNGRIRVFGNKNKLMKLVKVMPELQRIYSAIKISDNLLWLGTEAGLYEYDINLNRINKIKWSDLLYIRINCLLKDGEVVWIGTKGGGLLQVKGQNIFQYSIEDGIPGNSINAIEKKGNILWLATNKGIAKLEIDSLANKVSKIEDFTKANGLLNIEINDIALHNNTVFAATNNGLCYFGQQLSGINNIAPQVYFTGVKIMNTDTLIQDYYELDHNQNFIEFNFVGLSYQREKYLEYAYMLEGINKDWVKTQNRSIQFPMLHPGKYSFKVKCFNRSGIEGEIKTIVFKINKALYQKIWFKILVGIIILVIVAAIFTIYFYSKMKEAKKRNQIKNELNKYRQQALSAQMNPHFIYNSLNSIQSYILKNDRVRSSEYLTKFSNLMRKVLDNSQNSFISLKEEFDALNLYIEMELIRFRNSFEYVFNIQNNIKLDEYDIPPLILQPYVENAIHHGLRNKEGEKKLKIEVVKKEKGVCIIIEDNGIGRAEALKIKQRKLNTYKSYGTEITAKRIELFKESYKNKVKHTIFDLQSGNGKCLGTKVKIELQ